MKTKKIKYCFSIIFVISLIQGITNPITAQHELNKTRVWKYKINDVAEVVLDNYECDVEISTTEGNEVKFEMFVYAEASDEKDIKKLQDFLESLKFEAYQERVELSTQMWKKISSSNFMSSKLSNITLLNDEKITLSEFEREARLTIPASAVLILESKYSTVSIDNDIRKLELRSYNDKIYGGNIKLPAAIEAKYSKMEFDNMNDLSLDIYDCTFEASKSKITSVKSKYSNIEIGITSSLSIESYDDKFEIENSEDLSINAKYSDFSLGECGNMVLDVYDSNFEIIELKNLIIKDSKYSDIEFEVARDIKFYLSYDDEFNAGVINSIEIGESKYSTFEIEELRKRMTINGYDDNVSIDEVSEDFELFDADIKYGKIYLSLSDNLSFELDVKSKYGKLNLDREEFKTTVFIKENDELEFKGTKGNKTENIPTIKIRGYDVSVTL